MGDVRYGNVAVPFLGRLAEVLAADDRPEEAVLVSAESLDRIRATEALWQLPDALRIHGTTLLSLEGIKSEAAERHFREAIAISQYQGALGHELKATESLAEMLRHQGRIGEASARLDDALGKFAEGFGTTPYRRAKALLDEMGGSGADG